MPNFTQNFPGIVCTFLDKKCLKLLKTAHCLLTVCANSTPSAASNVNINHFISTRLLLKDTEPLNFSHQTSKR